MPQEFTEFQYLSAVSLWIPCYAKRGQYPTHFFVFKCRRLALARMCKGKVGVGVDSTRFMLLYIYECTKQKEKDPVNIKCSNCMQSGQELPACFDRRRSSGWIISGASQWRKPRHDVDSHAHSGVAIAMAYSYTFP